MKKIIENDIVQLISRLVVGFMFILVGLAKISDPQLFAKEIANYRLLPELLVNWTAIVLPWIELVCGLLLIVGVRLKANSAMIGAMLVMFIIFVASAWARGLDINCGCYSKLAEQTVGLQKILENTGLLLLTAISFFMPSQRLSLENLIEK